jgi:outer membrane protein TolC
MPRRWLGALVVVAAVVAGGIGGIASERVQDARERDRLIESIQSELELAQLRLNLARTDYEDTRRRFEVGMTDRESLEAAERRLREMQTAIAKLQLDIAEIRATAAAPRNELDAPLVGQRDFVRERVALELENAQRALVAAERAVEDGRRRVEIGTASRGALLRAETELAQARAEMQRLRMQLDIRQRALRGEIKAEEIARTVRLATFTLQLERAQREIEIARARLVEVRRLVEVGTAAPLDAKRAEVELLEREMELKRLRQELETLDGPRK